MRIQPLIIAIFSCFGLIITAIQGAAQENRSLFEYLVEENVNQLHVFAPMQKLIKLKLKDTSFQFSMSIADSITLNLDGEINVRGKYRRRTCSFPPYRLNFKKSSLETLGFSKHDKYKIVTHCTEDALFNNILYREYYVYKMYNVLDTLSFNVHPLTIQYTDTETGDSYSRPAFIIESNKELEDRIDGEIVEQRGLTAELLCPFGTERQAMFHHMIGNTDMDLRLMHNIKVIKSEVPYFRTVPYDFDFSKIVYAPYAHPSIKTKTYLDDRSYLGFRENSEQLLEIIEEYNVHENTLIELLKNADLLNSFDRRFMIRYIKSFYKALRSYPENLAYAREKNLEESGE